MTLSQFFHYGSSAIHYRVMGEGTPVVLVHGFGEDSQIWDRQAGQLQHNFKLIIPDLPGSGRSALLPAGRPATIEEYATVLKALLDHISSSLPAAERRYNMIGHSMGGYITLAFAEKFGSSLNSIGLVHSSAYADSDEKKAIRRKAIGFMQEHGAYEFLKTAIPGLFKEQGADGISAKDIQQLLENGRNFSAEVLIAYYEAMIARPDRTEVLKSFAAPVLLVMGQHDNAVPFAHSLQQAGMPSLADIHILRNSAHMGMLEEPEQLTQILATFLTTVSLL